MFNTLTTARTEFMRAQADDRMKRALKQRICAGYSKHFVAGDKVYFKKGNDSDFSGPGEILGQKGNQVLIWNAGRVIKSHPCKVILQEHARRMLCGEKLGDFGHDNSVTRTTTNVNNHGNDCATESATESASESSSDEDEELMTGLDSREQEDQRQDEQRPADLVDLNDSAEQENQSQAPDEPIDSVEPESHAQSHETWDKISNKDTENTRVELQPGDVVRYREDVDRDWVRAVVTERTGRSNQARNTFNIDENERSGRINCDKLQVEKLQVQTTEVAEQSETYMEGDIYLTKTEDPLVSEAKKTELERFKTFGVFREVKDQGQDSISSRWVITHKGNKCKARLVARGFEDYNYNITDAPTANKTSKFIFFILAASFGWKVETLDVVAAFLQASPIERDVWIKPPQDIRKPGILWRLLKPMYGLEDASRQWYFTLKKTLEELGCIISKLDKCVFCFYDQRANSLQGILLSHVDDIIYCGNTRFHDVVIKGLKKTFSVSKLNSGAFVYLGWEIQQQTECITISQRQYAKDIVPVKTTSDKKLAPEKQLTAEEVKLYQKLLGQLLWLSGQTRPDLAFDTMEHSMFNKKPTWKNQISLNKVVKKLPDGPAHIKFNKIDLKKEGMKIVFFCDASLGNLGPQRTDSGRGHIIFLVNTQGIGSVLLWSSNKVKRKVHSILGGETLSFLDGMSAAIYARSLISEMLYQDMYSKVIHITGVTDSRQLVESVSSTKQCTEPRLRIDMAEIQEAVSVGEITVKWTDTKHQLADALTKGTADVKLLCKAVEDGDISGFTF